MRQRFWIVQAEIDGAGKTFPVFTNEEPSMEYLNGCAEVQAIVRPPDVGPSDEDLGAAGIMDDDGEPDDEAVEAVDGCPPFSAVGPVEPEDAGLSNIVIFGPFEAPQLARTFRVRRPDCTTPVVIVQAHCKAAARDLCRSAFGICAGNGEQVTEMLPKSGINRILFPLP